jgi:hypothetical protein
MNPAFLGILNELHSKALRRRVTTPGEKLKRDIEIQVYEDLKAEMVKRERSARLAKKGK